MDCRAQMAVAGRTARFELGGNPITADESPENAPGRSVSAEISTRLVKLLREYTGRGPTKDRTYVHDELVVCMLKTR